TRISVAAKPRQVARSTRGSGVLTRTMAEKLGCDMLARDGVAAIWDLHLAALMAKDAGKLELAASLFEIARPRNAYGSTVYNAKEDSGPASVRGQTPE